MQKYTHIHQGGTLQAYCGASIAGLAGTVAWEEAPRATCPACVSTFGGNPLRRFWRWGNRSIGRPA